MPSLFRGFRGVLARFSVLANTKRTSSLAVEVPSLNNDPRFEDPTNPTLNSEQAHLTLASLLVQFTDSREIERAKQESLLKDLSLAFRRFSEAAQPSDLDWAIQLFTEAGSQNGPEGDIVSRNINILLGLLHRSRYDCRNEPADLDTAFQYFGQALESFTPDDPDRFPLLTHMADTQRVQYKVSGQISYINQAIDTMLQVAAILEEPAVFNSLGVCYQSRFQALGRRDDLANAIANQRLALSIAPDDHPDRYRWLNNLGNVAITAFHDTGNLEDLDLAIACFDQARSQVAHRCLVKQTILENLSEAYYTRYDYFGDTADLETALQYSSEAATLTGVESSSSLNFRQNLGITYLRRFGHSKDLSDLNMALNYLSEAAAQTPEADVSKPVRLHNLAAVYESRFSELKDSNDLQQAVESLTQAVSLTPEGHPNLPVYAHALGNLYMVQYNLGKDPVSLGHGIGNLARAVELTSDDHPNGPQRLHSLADACVKLFDYSEDPNHLLASVNYLQQAALSTAGPPLTRLGAAHTWALLSRLYDLVSPLDGYQRAMDLIPEVMWLGFGTASKRYEVVPEISSIVLGASDTAMLHEQEYLALEWLECGRSIIWSQLMELRAPLDQLAQIDASLAKRLREVSRYLESIAYGSSTILETSSTSREDTTRRHRQLARDREDLINQARSLPDMTGFLRAKKASELISAARTGAVVMINLTTWGCFAIIIRSNDTTVSSLRLNGFTHTKALGAHRDLKKSLRSAGRTIRGVRKASSEGNVIAKILYMLWVDVAEPVLQFLGYKNRVPELPHITWCTTGPLSMLPLHAAGDYNKQNCSLFDFAISSFTPTLSALLKSPVAHATPPRVLTVGQTHTPNQPPLLFTESELEKISLQVGESQITRLEGQAATTTTVSSALDEHTWVHFACHAYQDVMKPTSSGIHLYDGPLDLGMIVRKELVNADLAFLSACQTATGDETLSEESVHIAAAMVIAGFRRVIATIWSIDDEDAPVVAENFYAYMLDESKPNDRKAAKALAYAVGCLRDKVGVTAFERWAPYIHIGL
ncbi:CHAT domain protein [Ceratobasidium sp. AG-Ba]|nr:CHAT domain protein [Ceratobasidium sp. AG-Ba]